MHGLQIGSKHKADGLQIRAKYKADRRMYNFLLPKAGLSFKMDS